MVDSTHACPAFLKTLAPRGWVVRLLPRLYEAMTQLLTPPSAVPRWTLDGRSLTFFHSAESVGTPPP